MTSRQRLITALQCGIPDRLPVSTHHLMPSFLNDRMGGVTEREFFDMFGLDAVRWITPVSPDASAGQYFDPSHNPLPSQQRRVATDQWRIDSEDVPHPRYHTVRYYVRTPAGDLTTVLQSDAHTTWVAERLLKKKSDVEIIASYAPALLCDIDAVQEAADELGERGIVRGSAPGFDVYGQPGCWQDAAVLFGTEDLIFAVYDDPEWVKELLGALQRRKMHWMKSLNGARFELIELGGGDASSTVISPDIFENFVAPFDIPLIEAAHSFGQRIVYHICGGVMPILGMLADMRPDAIETFTPTAMGGDADLSEARRTLGSNICMIGGFDQAHYLAGSSPQRTREEVRRCFAEAGACGAYILAPSDHFFDAEIHLLHAYAQEAGSCAYKAPQG